MSVMMLGLIGMGVIAWFYIGERLAEFCEYQFNTSSTFGCGLWVFLTCAVMAGLGAYYGT